MSQEDATSEVVTEKKLFKKGKQESALLMAKKGEDLSKAVERLAGYGWDITESNAELDAISRKITRK
jgi:hypothetical protein